MHMELLNPGQIIASTTNPRKAFDAAKLQELANSIASQGIHTPVIVRPLPASRLADTVGLKPRPEYELVAGERRLRAARLVLAQGPFAGVPAIVRSLTDAEVLDIQLTENMQRDDLTHLEESDGIQLIHLKTISIPRLGTPMPEQGRQLARSPRPQIISLIL
jgi:ParB/RepB/Spo0J family partition protein